MSVDLRTLPLETTTWKQFRVDEPYVLEKKWPVPGLRGEFYEKEIDGVAYSYGTYFFKNTPTHRAWGIKSEPHCSFHAFYNNGAWSEPIEGCPNVMPVHNDAGVVVGYALTTGSSTHTWSA